MTPVAIEYIESSCLQVLCNDAELALVSPFHWACHAHNVSNVKVGFQVPGHTSMTL